MIWFSLTFFKVVLMRCSTCSLICLVNICGNAISVKIQPRWWWRTGKAGVLQFKEAQTVRCDGACCSPWYHKELDTTEQLNHNNVILGGTVERISLSMQEMPVPSLGQEDPLEEEMDIHSSILAWKIPWQTEEPGRLQSLGSQRVRYDSVIEHMQYPR